MSERRVGVEIPQGQWVTVERPGYQGKRKDADIARWNSTYGEGNWRLRWEFSEREVLGYPEIFWRLYVPGYLRYFQNNLEEAFWIVGDFAYAYDKDPEISYEQAFDPLSLYAKPGVPNQFHHVALNVALVDHMGLRFKGVVPLQVREGKPGTPEERQPLGYRWSPGRIPASRSDLVPAEAFDYTTVWWQAGSVEDIYQRTKVLQVKR